MVHSSVRAEMLHFLHPFYQRGVSEPFKWEVAACERLTVWKLNPPPYPSQGWRFDLMILKTSSNSGNCMIYRTGQTDAVPARKTRVCTSAWSEKMTISQGLCTDRCIYFKNSLSSNTVQSGYNLQGSLQETPLKNSHLEVFLQQHGSLEGCSSLSLYRHL